MKKSKFTDDQIVRILQEAESGQTSQAELCRRHRISPNTFDVWKRKFAGMQTEDVRRLKERIQEAARLGTGLGLKDKFKLLSQRRVCRA